MYACFTVARRAASRHARHARAQDADRGHDARVCDRAAHRAAVKRRAAGAGRDTVPRTPGDGSEGLGTLGVEAHPDEATRALLLDHDRRPKAPRPGSAGVRSRRRCGRTDHAAGVTVMPKLARARTPVFTRLVSRVLR